MKCFLTCSVLLAGLTLWWGQKADGQEFSHPDVVELEVVDFCDLLEEDDDAIALSICVDVEEATADALSNISKNAVFVSLFAEALKVLSKENLEQSYLAFRDIYPEHLLSLSIQAQELLELEEITPHIAEQLEHIEAYREAYLEEEMGAERLDVDAFAGIAALSERLDEEKQNRLGFLNRLKGSVTKESLLSRLFEDGTEQGPRDTSMASQGGPFNKGRVEELVEQINFADTALGQLKGKAGTGPSAEEVEEMRRQARKLAQDLYRSEPERVASDFVGSLLNWTCETFGWFCDDRCAPDAEECEEGDTEALERLISISCNIFGICPAEMEGLAVDDNGGLGLCDPRVDGDCDVEYVDLESEDGPILDTAGGNACDGRRGDDGNCYEGEEDPQDHEAAIRALSVCPPDADNCDGLIDVGLPIGPVVGFGQQVIAEETIETVDGAEVEEVPVDLPETE